MRTKLNGLERTLDGTERSGVLQAASLRSRPCMHREINDHSKLQTLLLPQEAALLKPTCPSVKPSFTSIVIQCDKNW